jgi:Domain of unknown function (DUF4129)
MSASSARRALTAASALLVLLALVALASRGHIAGSGGGQTRHIRGDLVLEYVLLILALMALVAVPLFAIGIVKAKEDPSILPARGPWMTRVFLTVAVFALAVIGILIYRSHHHSHGSSPGKPLKASSHKKSSSAQATRTVDFDWVPVIVVFSIAAAGAAVGGAYYLRSRGRRDSREKRAAVALGAALDESLDDLRRERDPRRAVIAAYARMEKALAASGLPRAAAEAPLEYLARVLRDFLRASAESVSRLTLLFERAKFSTHEIGPDMKDEAIDALVAIREELQAYS